ncbi:MAG TPA: hypothetical protein VLB44_08295 [Kofleriaceae bacterium]|nr:hypothetical protein [Kofleriaceae bacterium]
MAAVAVHGFEPVEGETAFAFCVLRLRQAVSRAALLELLRYMAPLIPDADTVIEELLPEDLEQAVQIIAVPWLPPEAGHAMTAQRRLVESAAMLGVEEAWFFQTGTGLPGEEDEDDDDTDDATQAGQRAFTRDDTWIGSEDDTKTSPIELIDASDADFDSDLDDEDDEDDDLDDDDLDDDDDDGTDEPVTWSHGPPPQVERPRFPVDGYPGIIEELDWEDVGVAVKLAGEILPGEGTVLLGFHTLWLAPYGGRYRNAAVTIDRKHHAAHLWVDRFAVPTPPAEQVRHLLWIVSKLAEVVPVVHARFVGATMAQKYGTLMGDTTEPFVLGGNPLLVVYAAGGQAAVDQWIEEQTVWSAEEVAQMLRELAIEIVTADDKGEGKADEEGAPVDGEDEGDDDDDDDDSDAEDEDSDDDDDDDDDDEAEGNEDEDRGRQITSHAGDLLRARAAQGKLDPRVADRLLPILTVPEKFEHRRHAVVEILRTLRHRAAVPALIDILEATTIKSAADSVGKEELVAATAAALGAIADPAAIPALSKVVAAPGTHNDAPRAVAADALAACLAATPEPRTVDDAVLAELLTTIRERNDGELNAETHFAYGRLVRLLSPERRAVTRKQLADADTARDDAVAMLARQAALVLASPTSRVDAPPRDLASLLHEGLTSLDYDHEYTVRNLRVALQVAELVPEVVQADDLSWLTAFVEPDIRERAHALLVKLGKPLEPAPVFDRYSVRELGDPEIVRLISETRVIGRAALIAEAGRRGLSRAKRGIIDACHDVISRARRGGENLLDPDTRVLEAAVPILRKQPLDEQVVALFDRMLRHTNYHVKWELLQKPPKDERLIAGMFHVLGEKWGWQETAAKEWLAAFQGTPVYEAERKRATSSGSGDDEGNDAPSSDDDEDIN